MYLTQARLGNFPESVKHSLLFQLLSATNSLTAAEAKIRNMTFGGTILEAINGVLGQNVGDQTFTLSKLGELLYEVSRKVADDTLEWSDLDFLIPPLMVLDKLCQGGELDLPGLTSLFSGKIRRSLGTADSAPQCLSCKRSHLNTPAFRGELAICDDEDTGECAQGVEEAYLSRHPYPAECLEQCAPVCAEFGVSALLKELTGLEGFGVVRGEMPRYAMSGGSLGYSLLE